MNQGISLYDVQYKIANGMQLTAAEKAFVMKAANEKGQPSRRRFTGWAEPPNSVADEIA